MADLFSVTAPLRIQINKQQLFVIAECYPHPEGLVYLDLYWNEALADNDDSCIHLIKAELKGDGPWKIADNVIHVLGCHGTNAQLASEYASWIEHSQVTNFESSRKLLNKKLELLGVESKYLKQSKIIYLDVNNSSK
jgi:hypothetical protein